MIVAFVDTNIFIRFFVNDHSDQHSGACHLFEQVRAGQVKLIAPHTVLDEVVFVLSSPRLYQSSLQAIAACLTPLLKMRGMQVYQREAIVSALALYANTKLDFADCVTIALAQAGQVNSIYSYDKDFDAVEGINRLEPERQ
jgi:predicted nucleic acid-binding protein